MITLNFSRELRLLTPSQFKYVFQDPLRASSPEITILARQNDLEHPRLGLTVAKKHLKHAPELNAFVAKVFGHYNISYLLTILLLWQKLVLVS